MIRTIFILSLIFLFGFTGCTYARKDMHVAPSYHTILTDRHTLEVLQKDFELVSKAVKAWASQNGYPDDSECPDWSFYRFGRTSPSTFTFCAQGASITVEYYAHENATFVNVGHDYNRKLVNQLHASLKSALIAEFSEDAIR